MGQSGITWSNKIVPRTWPKTKLKRQNYARNKAEKKGFGMAHSCKIKPRPFCGIPRKFWARRSRNTMQMLAKTFAPLPLFFVPPRARIAQSCLAYLKRNSSPYQKPLNCLKECVFLRIGHQRQIYLGEMRMVTKS